MRTSPFKKLSLLLVAAAAALLTGTRWMPDDTFTFYDNDVLKNVRAKLAAYNKRMPAEKLYLHTDKTFYKPGEDIWFSAYLRDAASLKPSAVSGLLYAELIGPAGNTERKLTLVCREGRAAGDFHLDAGKPGGLYRIRAYTSWMKNWGENNYFEKELQVQELILPRLKMQLSFIKKAYGPGDEVLARLQLNTNENKVLAAHPLKFAASIGGKELSKGKAHTDEDGLAFIRFRLPADLKSSDGLLNVMIDYNGSTESISRSVPVLLQGLRLDFYPEGGDLVEGLLSRVAFRARNSFGKPADVEGLVLSAGGATLSQFSSFHQGMGSFDLKPVPGQKYFVKITRPLLDTLYELPEALPRGMVMRAGKTADGVEVDILSNSEAELGLVGQMQGRVVYAKAMNAFRGSNKVLIPTAQLQAGVMQLTLFDQDGVARAERLVFVGEDKKLSLTVKTDKEKYLPREKVSLSIQVRDNNGMPMPAKLSLAVVNDQLLSFADDKQGNLLSELLLQQELKEKVEEPAFYFDAREKKAPQALDLLLMTSGWRRFTWEQVLSGHEPPVRFGAEKAQLNGSLRDGESGRAIAHAKIVSSDGFCYESDSAGNFFIGQADLAKPYFITVKAQGYPEYRQSVHQYGGLNLTLYRHLYRKRLERMEVPVMAMNAVADMQAPMAERMDMAKEPNEKKAGHEAIKLQRPLKAQAIPVPAEGDALLVEDLRFRRAENADGKPVADQEPGLYYRAREFSAPVYAEAERPEYRSDFRSTLYWNPCLEIGKSGKASVEFFAGDEISSFRTVVEGIAVNGQPGRCEALFFTQLPFGMQVKAPVEVLRHDKLVLPLTLHNNTGKPIGGLLSIVAGAGLRPLQPIDSVQTIMPGQTRLLQLQYQVSAGAGPQPLKIRFSACGLSDAFEQVINVKERGFPAAVSFSSQDMEKTFRFDIGEPVAGSLKASFTAYPDVVSDLMTGVEGILQEPYGCFEQTSCTAYPNAMVLSYLKNTGNNDARLMARATDLLDRGYRRLTTFETGTRGYEWFGASPAHEGLTAYGIMEFVDMKRAGQAIDEGMLGRTAQWLLAHRDGKGGFEREKRALHDFGRISDEIMNAYIVYALAEAGYTEVTKEFNVWSNRALQSKDPYMLAMMSNAGYCLNQAEQAGRCLAMLIAAQQENGSFKGSTHSITYSQGSSLLIETTALSVMAMLKAPSNNLEAIRRAVKFLVESRSGSGVFGSTQGTILALKALTAYAVFSKRTAEGGSILVYVDGKKVAEERYAAGASGNIGIAGLEKYLKDPGKHSITVKFAGTKNALPYSLSVKWHSALPASEEACALGLSTRLSAHAARVGETLRLDAEIYNKRDAEVPTAMAVIGLPGGLSVQAWQLKELQEKHVFDYYELIGNSLALYYRGLGAGDKRQISLDLKAELAGEYQAQASCAYLYYTNEHRCWITGEKVSIRQ